MDADVVYKVAKALPKEELHKLFNMLQSDIKDFPFTEKSKKVKNLPVFTKDDALRYAINHFNISRTP